MVLCNGVLLYCNIFVILFVIQIVIGVVILITVMVPLFVITNYNRICDYNTRYV